MLNAAMFHNRVNACGCGHCIKKKILLKVFLNNIFVIVPTVFKFEVQVIHWYLSSNIEQLRLAHRSKSFSYFALPLLLERIKCSRR